MTDPKIDKKGGPMVDAAEDLDTEIFADNKDDGLGSQLCGHPVSGLMAMTHWLDSFASAFVPGVQGVIYRVDDRLFWDDLISGPDIPGKRMLAAAKPNGKFSRTDAAINKVLEIAEVIFDAPSDQEVARLLLSPEIQRLHKEAWEALFDVFLTADGDDSLVGIDLDVGECFREVAGYVGECDLASAQTVQKVEALIERSTGEVVSADDSEGSGDGPGPEDAVH